ncbi:hypothetical protein QJS10_CPA08g00877 [Acorus calamus]|uniref:Uncharacterized protein n=1 Tax=Acorus calamus TaxID=4465 RepID=A0AAV9EEZ7_ACOCL|nr:hypothetical protein QJS10_CPA08g00877 [Acorus calamus]
MGGEIIKPSTFKSREFNLDLRVPEIMYMYELRKSGKGYHFRARDSKEKFTYELPDSDKNWAVRKSRLGDVFVAPSSPLVDEPDPSTAPADQTSEAEEHSKEELELLYKLGFGDPMATECSSRSARNNSRPRRGSKNGPKPGKKSCSSSVERTTLSFVEKEKRAKLAALQADIDRCSGNIGKLPGPEKRKHSPTRQAASTPTKKSKQYVVELQVFIPAPRTKTRPVRVSDSGLKDHEVAIGLMNSVVLDKDRALAEEVSVPEAGSILQGMAYQEFKEISEALVKKKTEKVRVISEAEHKKKEMELDFEIQKLLKNARALGSNPEEVREDRRSGVRRGLSQRLPGL